MSKGRKFIIPEDFGFKPDSYLLSLKLTDICNKGEFETNKERLKKVFGPQNEGKWLSINTLKLHIKTLLTNPSKFPSHSRRYPKKASSLRNSLIYFT